jgi:riboflavin biosynthesis pyrimidine reductase
MRPSLRIPTLARALRSPLQNSGHGGMQTPFGESTKMEADSGRRKYRKMRAKFDETMSASNTLIKEEYRAMAVLARLQEQNECDT